ncbi:MAG: hypothetical protein AVDCRST_MAG01-01-2069, partial [uncultured Rubrobacteraceae bacterium]
CMLWYGFDSRRDRTGCWKPCAGGSPGTPGTGRCPCAPRTSRRWASTRGGLDAASFCATWAGRPSTRAGAWARRSPTPTLGCRTAATARSNWRTAPS